MQINLRAIVQSEYGSGKKSSKSRIEDSPASNSEPTTLSLRAVFDRKCQSKHTVDRLNPQTSVTSSLDQQILRRPVFVASFRADYYRVARRPCGRPALSELGVKVAFHPAQALRTPL